jgi:hypothetical protein
MLLDAQLLLVHLEIVHQPFQLRFAWPPVRRFRLGDPLARSRLFVAASACHL